MKQDIVAIIGLALFVGGIGWFSRGIAAAVLGLVLMGWAYVTSKPSKPAAP